MTVIMMFAGQGTQCVGMGAALFDRFPDVVRTADAVLGYSIVELCLHGPAERLDSTRFAQPAVFTVNELAYRAVLLDGGVPDALIGYSLGEYNALVAAHCLDFGQGLALVRRRAELTSGVSGQMSVVRGLTEDEVTAALDQADIANAHVAIHVETRQFVLAGTSQDIARAERAVQEAGATAVRRLAVSAPFHSPLMAASAERFAEYVGFVRFAAPRMPVIANPTALPHSRAVVPARLVEHIHRPVLWRQSLELLVGLTDSQFVEIGGNTLGRTVAAARQGRRG